MVSPFHSPFTTLATAAATLEVSDSLGRVPTEDLDELFVTNAPSESISRGVSRPPTLFGTPQRNGSAFATTRMFDMSKFDRTASQPSAATTTGTKSSGLFGPSPSGTTTQDAHQQQRGFSFVLAPNCVTFNSPAGAPGQGAGFVFQSGGTARPMFGAATSLFGGAFQSAQLVNHSKTVTPPKAEFGTGFPPYKTYDATPNHVRDGVTFHTICAMPAYAHKSPEEWRLEDYIKKEKGIPTLTTVKTTGCFPSADVPRNPFAMHTATPSTTSGAGVFSFVSSPVPHTQANISAFSSSSLFGSLSASNASGDFGSATTSATATQGFGRTSGTAFGFSAEPNESASLFGQATKFNAPPAIASPRFGETQESGSSGFSFGGQSRDSSASSFSFGQSNSPGISFGSQYQESNNSGSLFGQSTSSDFSFGASNDSSISFGQNQESSTSGSLFGQPSGSGFSFDRSSGSPGLGFCFGGQAQGSGALGFSFGGSTGSGQGSSNSGSLFGQPSGSGFSFGGQQQPEATTSLFGSASGFGFGSTTGTETTALSFRSATTNAGDSDSDDRNVQQQSTGFKFGSETGNALARDSIGGGGGNAGSSSFGYSASSPSSSSINCDNRDSSISVPVFGQQPAAASDSERKSADSDTSDSSELRSTQGHENEAE